MTDVLSIFVKCVWVKFLCCCTRVLQCQPRWRPIANHLYKERIPLRAGHGPRVVFIKKIQREDRRNLYFCSKFHLLWSKF